MTRTHHRLLVGLAAAALGALSACSGSSGDDPDGGGDGGSNNGSGDGGVLYRGQLPDDVHALGFRVEKQGDKLIAVGSGTRDGGTTGGDLFVARFSGDGTLDTTFGSGGMALVDGKGTESNPFLGNRNSDGAYWVNVEADRILLTGTARAFTFPGAGVLASAAFDSEGHLQTAWGNSEGLRIDSFGSDVEAHFTRIHRQADGKYVMGGGVQGNFLVVRFNADGSADTSFAKTPGMGFGAVYGGSSQNELVLGMVEQAGGKIVVGGGEGFYSTRVNADGTQDTGYGVSGFFRRGGGNMFALLAREGGKLLHLGSTSERVDGADIFKLVMFQTDADGVADASFGADGKREVVLPIKSNILRGVAQAADGSVVLYISGLGTWLVRLTSDLQLDTAFGPTGGARELDIKLPLFQSLMLSSNHLLLDGNRVWITDISSEKYAEPDKKRNFFVLRKYDL